MTDLTEQEQHRLLMIAIQKLPPKPAGSLNQAQNLFLQDQNARWRLIGARLDYLRGYRPRDPLKDMLSPELRVLVEKQADLYLTYLNLMIKGFEFIQECARKDGIPFPFRYPMELLLAVLAEHADCSYILQAETRSSKMELYQEGQRWYKFLSSQLDKPEEDAILAELKALGWHGYWLACLWSFPRKQQEFPGEWKSLIKGYRNLIYLEKRYARKSQKGKWLFTPLNWRNGIPFSSQNGSPVSFIAKH